MTQTYESAYLKVMAEILHEGTPKVSSRTQFHSIALHGAQIRVDLEKEFPLVTTKKMGLRQVWRELKWFLSGMCNNIMTLDPKAHRLWENWVKDSSGDLGPIYGYQWRSWPVYRESFGQITKQPPVDQIERALDLLSQAKPTSRQIVVNAWNAAMLADMALPPCHMAFQFLARRPSRHQIIHTLATLPGDLKKKFEWHPDIQALQKRCLSAIGGESHQVDIAQYEAFCDEAKSIAAALNIPALAKLFAWRVDLRVDQRSADWFVGVPFNLASYAMLCHIICATVNKRVGSTHVVPGQLIHQFGDCHIYSNQIEVCKTQCERTPFSAPEFAVKQPHRKVDDYVWSDFVLVGYDSHERIKAPELAV